MTHTLAISRSRRKRQSIIEQDDLKIIQAIKTGHNNSFQKIVDKYEPYLFITVVKIVKDEEEAKDILQDIFVKVYSNLSKYKPDFTFNAWITRLTMNHMMDVLRKKKALMHHNFISLDVPYVSVDGSQVHKMDIADEDSLSFDEESYEDIHLSQYKKVSEAMNELNSSEKKIVQMFYLEKVRQTDIARAMNLTSENLRIKLLRIKVKLRKILAGDNLKLEKSF